MFNPLKMIGNREKDSRNKLRILTKTSRLMLFRNVKAICNNNNNNNNTNYIKSNVMMELRVYHSALNDQKASVPILTIYLLDIRYKLMLVPKHHITNALCTFL